MEFIVKKVDVAESMTVGQLIEQRSYRMEVRSQMIGLSRGSDKDSGGWWICSLINFDSLRVVSEINIYNKY